MLLIRICLLWGLVCLHVVGGAVLFRRLFPRESPWWGFFLPTLAFVSVLDFVEHFVALPSLEWLLPVSTGVLIWFMVRSGRWWKALRFPGLLFVGAFSFTLAVKCALPDINFYCTEGLTDYNRILDFCLGDKIPPRDCWLTPYPHTGYYTFMQYGASLLKRLLGIDVGTAYNISSALVSALTLLAGGASAYSLGRHRVWIPIVTMIVLAGGFTGSTPIHMLLHPSDVNPCASIDIGGGDPGDVVHQEFGSLLRRSPPDIAYRIYTPGAYIYYSEFHATMAGHLLALLAIFGAAEVLRRRRSSIPWIYLLVAPALVLVSCPWFVFITGLLASTMLAGLLAGRRPLQWPTVAGGAVLGLVLLWPAINDLSHGAMSQPFYWTNDLPLDFWTVVIQWWPIYIPWMVLCFAWPRMDFQARWLHFVLVPICISVEAFFLTDRGTTLEKTWSGAFGVGLVILYPILFMQKGGAFRTLSVALILCGFLSMAAWSWGTFQNVGSSGLFLHLEGDHFVQENPSLNRMEEVLGRVHGKTVLAGVAPRAWFEAPCLAAFTENRCYLGWANAEETAGHGDEAHDRQKKENAFYAGTLPSSMDFLKDNDIAAVLVWPDDKMSADWLLKMKEQIGAAYTYFDCQGDGPNPAGVFLRISDLN